MDRIDFLSIFSLPHPIHFAVITTLTLSTFIDIIVAMKMLDSSLEYHLLVTAMPKPHMNPIVMGMVRLHGLVACVSTPSFRSCNAKS